MNKCMNFLGKGILSLTLLMCSSITINAMQVTQADKANAGILVKNYAMQHKNELGRALLLLVEPGISEEELNKRAPLAKVTDATLYLWAASRLNTPAAKAWYKENYPAATREPVLMIDRAMAKIANE